MGERKKAKGEKFFAPEYKKKLFGFYPHGLREKRGKGPNSLEGGGKKSFDLTNESYLRSF